MRTPALTISHCALRADQELGDPLERALRRRQADPLNLNGGHLLGFASGGAALCRGRTSSDRRSSVSARWAPRFDWATAWISSTITASTPVRISRTWLVSIRYSDSGVVIRMSGRRALHRLALLLRGVTSAQTDGHLGADALQRRAQVALDVVAKRLQRRDVDQDPALLRFASERRSGRLRGKPVDAPEEGAERLARPVGAQISVWAPDAIFGHPAC